MQSSKPAQISVSKEVIDIDDTKPEIVQEPDYNEDKITTKPEIVQESLCITQMIVYGNNGAFFLHKL